MNPDKIAAIGCLVYIMYVLLYFSAVGAVIYVAVHFVSKYW